MQSSTMNINPNHHPVTPTRLRRYALKTGDTWQIALGAMGTEFTFAASRPWSREATGPIFTTRRKCEVLRCRRGGNAAGKA